MRMQLRQTVSDGAREDESWLLDSGASHYLTGDRSRLTDLKTVADGLRTEFGDKK
jgi:hypothetical protein